MNVGSLMSSLTSSDAGGAPAPFASVEMVCGSFEVFTGAMDCLQFPSNPCPLRAVGPSGGVARLSMSVLSGLSPGTGAMRPPRVGLVHDCCVLLASAVVIPAGEIVTSARSDLLESLLFERGE